VDIISTDDSQALILMMALDEDEMDNIASAHELRPHLDWATLVEKDDEMWLMLSCHSEEDLDAVQDFLRQMKKDVSSWQLRKVSEATYKEFLDEGFSRIIDGNALEAWERSRWDEAALPWD